MKIFNTYKQRGYKHFKVFFSGGEPTHWENFIPLVKHLKEKIPNITVAVNTNLSRPLKYWKEHYHLFDDIVASFHVEFCKKDRYIENAKFLCDKVDYLCTKMLMHDDRFWEVVEFGKRVRQEVPNYNLEWTPLFDEMSVNAGPWQYKDPIKQNFLENAEFETVQRIDKPYRENYAVSMAHYDTGIEPVNSNKIIAARQNFFKGWKCQVDDALFINPRGDISGASCGVGQTHGNITNENLTFDLKPVICNKDHCHCGTDIIIPKEPMRV
jgi:organic radical activating enzyme